MNRRELIAAGVAAAVGVPAAAQQSWKIECTPENCLTTNLSPFGPTPEANILGGTHALSAEEKAQQYALCQERGHTPTIFAPTFQATYATGIIQQDHRPAVYPNLGSGEWQTCWYCKTRYRFVTTMEEEGKP